MLVTEGGGRAELRVSPTSCGSSTGAPIMDTTMIRSNRIGLGAALFVLGIGMIGYAQVQEDELARGLRERRADHMRKLEKWGLAKWNYEAAFKEHERLESDEEDPFDYEAIAKAGREARGEEEPPDPQDPGSRPRAPSDYHNLLLIFGGICCVVGVGLTAASMASKPATPSPPSAE